MQEAGSKPKAVSQASLEEIMADRLDASLLTKGKAFAGDMVNRMVSGISEQVAGLAEAQERTVGTRRAATSNSFTRAREPGARHT